MSVTSPSPRRPGATFRGAQPGARRTAGAQRRPCRARPARAAPASSTASTWRAGGSHIDNQTSIDHRAPSCTQPRVYRGVVAGRGQAVWSGRAVVRPGAHGTDARQTQSQSGLSRRRRGPRQAAPRNLRQRRQVLARRHHAAASIAEALFYLRSRGIGEREARQILIAAFLREGSAAVRRRCRCAASCEAVLAGRTAGPRRRKERPP